MTRRARSPRRLRPCSAPTSAALFDQLLGRNVEQLARGRRRRQLVHHRAALAHALLRAQVRGRHAAAAAAPAAPSPAARARCCENPALSLLLREACRRHATVGDTSGDLPCHCAAWHSLPRIHRHLGTEYAHAPFSDAKGRKFVRPMHICVQPSAKRERGQHLVLHEGQKRRNHNRHAPDSTAGSW